MGRRKLGNRIDGPYYEPGYGYYAVWIEVDPDAPGNRGCTRRRARLDVPAEKSDRNKALADIAVEDARDELETPSELTVRQVVDNWTDRLDRESCKAYADADRAALLPLVTRYGDIQVGKLAAKHAEYLFLAHATKALATRRSYHKAASRFSAAQFKRGACLRNFVTDFETRLARREEALPWATKKGRESVNRGKLELRTEAEVAAYTRAALALDYPQRLYGKEKGPRARLERVVAATMLVWTGLRSGERAAVDLQFRAPP